MKAHEVDGSAEIVWNYPEIGTGTEPADELWIVVMRVRAISDLILSFDGNRNGWVVSGRFPKTDGSGLEIREVAFVPEWDNAQPFDAV